MLCHIAEQRDLSETCMPVGQVGTAGIVQTARVVGHSARVHAADIEDRKLGMPASSVPLESVRDQRWGDETGV